MFPELLLNGLSVNDRKLSNKNIIYPRAAFILSLQIFSSSPPI